MQTLFSNKFHKIIFIGLLVILPISSSLCIDMYLPAYSDIAKSFVTSEGMVNLSMSIYLFGLALGQLFYGPMSDRFGRKSMLMYGMILFFISNIVCTISSNIEIFLFARLGQAIGACSSIVLCRAITSDVFHPETRVKIFALISASNIFSPALAPALGSYINSFFGWRAIFSSITLFSVLILICILFIFRESLLEKNLNSLKINFIINNLRELYKNHIFPWYVLSIAFIYASVFVWVTYSPGVIIDYFGVSKEKFGLFFIIPAIGNTVGAIITAKFSHLFNSTKFINTGIIISAFFASLLCILFLTKNISSAYTLTFFIMILFFCNGLIFPQLISEALLPFGAIAGFTSGIIGFVQTLTGSITAVTTSAFYSSGPHAMVILMVITVFGVIVCFTIAKLMRRKHTELISR